MASLELPGWLEASWPSRCCRSGCSASLDALRFHGENPRTDDDICSTPKVSTFESKAVPALSRIHRH